MSSASWRLPVLDASGVIDIASMYEIQSHLSKAQNVAKRTHRQALSRTRSHCLDVVCSEPHAGQIFCAMISLAPRPLPKSVNGKPWGRPPVLLTKARYGRWSIVSLDEKANRQHWFCRCDCGTMKSVAAADLRTGRTTSCGCRRREVSRTINWKHGKTDSRAYKIWCSMKGRCYNKKLEGYKDYGGRGISVCRRWQNNFAQFLEDMGHPNDNHSIDRVNNNHGYSPKNCRCATDAEQARNTRRTRNLTYRNETKCIADWIDDPCCKVAPNTFYHRIQRGWTMKEALAKPPYMPGGTMPRKYKLP